MQTNLPSKNIDKNNINKISKTSQLVFNTPKITEILSGQSSVKQSGYSNILLKTYPIESYHHAIELTLKIGQWFGLLPVCGLNGKDASYLEFKWMSWQVIHSIQMIIGVGVITFLSFYFMIFNGFTVDNAGMLIFYGAASLTQVLFFKLALKWPRLSSEIQRVENICSLTPRYSNADVENGITLKMTFNIWSTCILTLAFVEHALCVMSGISAAYNCRKDLPLLEAHYTSAFPQVFYFTNYSKWKAIVLQIMNLSATFAWNFMDLFIILVSLGLRHQLNYLNRNLSQTMGKECSNHFWSSARDQYSHLCRLVHYIDKHICSVIFLSFSENLYIICKQLFNSLKTDKLGQEGCWLQKKGLFGGEMPSIYFGYSFSFLICRFLAVALAAAEIHNASKKPLGPLYYVSQECYTLEVTRFIDQVTTEGVSLSGLRIFHVTRSFILTVASTVVTYELVMVQFYMPKIPSDCSAFINTSIVHQLSTNYPV